MRSDHIIVFHSHHKNHKVFVSIRALCHCVFKCTDDQKLLHSMGSLNVWSSTWGFTTVSKLGEAKFKSFYFVCLLFP